MLELNRIYHQDCVEGLKQVDDNSIDLILTDPPYGIDFLSHWTNNHIKIENDTFDDWDKNMEVWLGDWYRVIKPNGVICCCCGGGKTPVSQIFTLKSIKQGFNLIQTIIWDKKTIGLGWRYRPSYETIVVLSKSKDAYNFYSSTKDISNIVKINNIIPQTGDHPTPKPEKLMRFFINLHSREGDIVLDPFIGGGTTAVACKQTNRNFIGFEINEKYIKIAEERLTQRTLENVNLFNYTKQEDTKCH